MEIARIVKKYRELFGSEPDIFQSPGRINLIGEHTDYNDGFVLPAAINKTIVAAMNLNTSNLFRFYSLDYDEYFEIKTSEIKIQNTLWTNYLLGVIAQFQKKGLTITGFDCVFKGDIPIGAGLSSSAALECVIAFGINELFGFNLDKMQLVKLSQKAEHEYAGVHCGIMDQFASVFGKENHAMMLDCRSLEYEYTPILLDDYSIVLVDSKVSHSLASSEYNTRRKECETGVEILKKHRAGILALRDADIELLETYRSDFPANVFKRCKYVVEENNRVLMAKKALQEGNLLHFGKLVYASHNGLSEEYEVSCSELDTLIEIAKESNHVIGARMMGGGFGGCTINFVDKSHTDDFCKSIVQEYKKRTGIDAEYHIVKISNGTGKSKV